MSTSSKPVATARKDRRKSRFGCRNCKLRRVKCDETKPHCQNCRCYGVWCNFDFKAQSLQPLSERLSEDKTKLQKKIGLPLNLFGNALWSGEGSFAFMIDTHDQLLFTRFQHRTLLSIGGSPMAEVYEKSMLQAAFQRPFLMHAMLAMAAIHDRYLGLNSSASPSLRELNHWSACTTLFKKSLSEPINEEDRDPCWATASILGIVTFASIHTNQSSKSWPLVLNESSNLDWIRLGSGKMQLWQMLNPLRPESAFHSMSETLVRMRQRLPEKGIKGVKKELVDLCGLDETTKEQVNPYFTVAHALSRLEDDDSYGTAVMVGSCMHGEFGTLLLEKDPIALVLLYLWQSKVRRIRWWFEMRARVEIPAIRSYLQRFHADDSRILGLVV